MVEWGPLRRWLFTTNHKDIGILYLLTSMYFLVAGGVLALTFRVQLSVPESEFLNPDSYNQAVTLHGLIMVLWVITPMAAAFANYVVPIQIGAKDMAFPRLNALSYWVYLASGMMVLSSFFAPGGTADWGWTTYAPLNTLRFSPATSGSVMGLALMLLMASGIVSTVNFLVTIFRLRAPGMKLVHMPLFTWFWLFTLLLMLWAFPAFLAPLTLLVADRVLGTVFFTSAEGGSLLWNHLFWFFGHPEVYILVLAGLGIIGELFSVFSRRPVYGKKIIIASLIAASILSYTVWVHHMFMTGVHRGLREAFNITTEIISIPFGIIVLSYMFTLIGGRIRFKTPMLFAIGALILFTIGGVSGVFNSSVALNYGLRGTFWVVAHFHYVIVGGALTGLFAGLYYWFPKMTGRMYNEKLGKIHFITYFVGFNLLYFPMHFLIDMPRRIVTYGAETGWGDINLLITVGGFIFGFSQIVMFANLLYSLVKGPVADKDPWGGASLEWITSSPPPKFNFDEGIPVITTQGVEFQTSAPNGGTVHEEEYGGEHLSPWPIIVSAGAGIALLGAALSLPLFVLGLVVFALSVIGWGWEDLREKFHVTVDAIGEKWPFDGVENSSLGMWFFVFGEITFFGSLIGGYVFLRANSTLTGFWWPPPGQVHDIFFGAFNTIILITSGLTMALALHSIRQGSQRGLRASLLVTFLLGLLFLINKGIEWTELFSEGITFSTDIASSTYFLLTGVHGAHVLSGLLAMVYLITKAFRGGFSQEKHKAVESFGIYWGVVVSVWVLLFPLFYLL
ncbi:MAG: cbb3-type cytochrome c oxidase subunit I [Anaerolineae bacterium]